MRCGHLVVLFSVVLGGCAIGASETDDPGNGSIHVDAGDASSIGDVLAPETPDEPLLEICDNGIDDDGDGRIDEGCPDAGPPDVGAPIDSGTTAYDGSLQDVAPPPPKPPPPPPCDVTVVVKVSSDCATITCPKSSPYPKGCDITMTGTDCEGCVASTPTKSSVFFEEGYRCGTGPRVSGTLSCSCKPGVGLNAYTCPIKGKSSKHWFYPTTPDGCPSKDTCG